MDFFSCQSLRQVICSPDGKLREIYRFNECLSLERIEISSSVEITGCRTRLLIRVFSQPDVIFIDYGFHCCTSLREVVFAERNDMRDFKGFHECPLIKRVEKSPERWNLVPRQIFLHHSVGNMARNRRKIQLRFLPSSQILDVWLFRVSCPSSFHEVLVFD
jgi:hypothetical protein